MMSVNKKFGRQKIRTIPAILVGLLMLGCHAGKAPPQETITGFVVERRANTKSFDSWNAPSDPYYVLETKERSVTLRPSPSMPTDKFATLRGKRVLITGYHTESEPHNPSEEGGQYPMESATDLQTNEVVEPFKMRPPNRGVGFVVTRILEMK